MTVVHPLLVMCSKLAESHQDKLLVFQKQGLTGSSGACGRLPIRVLMLRGACSLLLYIILDSHEMQGTGRCHARQGRKAQCGEFREGCPLVRSLYCSFLHISVCFSRGLCKSLGAVFTILHLHCLLDISG